MGQVEETKWDRYVAVRDLLIKEWVLNLTENKVPLSPAGLAESAEELLSTIRAATHYRFTDNDAIRPVLTAVAKVAQASRDY
jgi:hypothetical protein